MISTKESKFKEIVVNLSYILAAFSENVAISMQCTVSLMDAAKYIVAAICQAPG